MKLYELIYKDEYTFLSSMELLNLDISGISSDSRNITENFAFVALGGSHSDGVYYAFQAQANGACVCICESPPVLCDIPYVKVKNSRAVLSLMLARFYGSVCNKMKVYALTGTNGKTSTALILKNILMQSGVKTGYIGTLKCYVDNDRFYLGGGNDEKISTMTTPDPEELYMIISKMYGDGVRHLVVEASSHALKLDKLLPIRMSASAFLNFSSDHLDFHMDTTDYLLSKCKIFSMSDKVYVNSDDAVCSSAGRVFRSNVATYSAKDVCSDYRACDIKYHGYDGVSYTLRYGKRDFSIESKLFGDYSVYNTLSAASVALGDGVDEGSVRAGILSVQSIDGRLERVSENSDIAVFIDYAHTEKAMEGLLRTVMRVKKDGQRIITVFGCGGERDREKRAPMARAASEYSDLVIVTEDNSRGEDINCIINDIMRGIDKGKNHKVIQDRREAIHFAIKNARENDIVLLVGKGHEQYEITKDGKRPFSEKDAVYEALRERDSGGKK